MPLVFTERTRDVVGSRRRVAGSLTFDNSYPTGGESYDASIFGLSLLDEVFVAAFPAAGAKLVAHDVTNKKVKVFTAISTEAAASSDQSTVVVDVMAFGK